MLKDSLQQIYAKVFLLQVSIAVCLVLILLPIDKNFSLSALVGAVAVLAGNASYMLWETRGGIIGLGRKNVGKKRFGARIFGRHVVAELLKVAVISGLLAAALASAWFSALWVVLAAIIVIVGHGLAFLIIH